MKIIILLICVLLVSCTSHSIVEPVSNIEIEISVKKWYNGHSSAVSITYDGAWSTYSEQMLQEAVDKVTTRGLRMDFELITSLYESGNMKQYVDKMRNELIPKGIHFFGHGHEHVNHDELSFGEAYNSFKTCFDLMEEWGLNPLGYAYPGSAGRESKTQLANEMAGFICARGVAYTPEGYYLCPDDITEPEKWHYHGSVPVAKEYENYINNNSEMVPVLNGALDNNSWLILMYHSIGIEGGWGWYEMEEFIKDLDYIQDNDFWSGNMGMVAAYIKERNNFTYTSEVVDSTAESITYEIKLNDDLDNSIFYQPLTFEMLLNTNTLFTTAHFNPPVNDKTDYEIIDNKIRFNAIPDEEILTVTFRK